MSETHSSKPLTRRGILLGIVLAHAVGIHVLSSRHFTPPRVEPERAIEVALLAPAQPEPLPTRAEHKPEPAAQRPEQRPREKTPQPVARTPLEVLPQPTPIAVEMPQPKAVVSETAQPVPSTESSNAIGTAPTNDLSELIPATSAATPAEAPATAPRFDVDYLRNPRPAYPMLAKRMGEQGEVRLKVYVTADGRAEKLAIKSSSGSTRLDNAALQAVANWRFVPARQGERTIAAWVIVPIVFTLENS